MDRTGDLKAVAAMIGVANSNKDRVLLLILILRVIGEEMLRISLSDTNSRINP